MNWSRQTNEPLFPDVLWSRPENRRHAGKLLVIGGHSQNFSAASEAYAAAGQAGAGTVRVIVPDKLRPMLSKIFMEAEYAASNEIGSFGRKALADFLDAADWSDGVLLAGELGKNSETAVLIDNFTQRYEGFLCLAGDCLDYFLSKEGKAKITERHDTILVADIARLQKIALPDLIRQTDDFIKVIEQVSDWTAKAGIGVVTWNSGKIIAAYGDRLSSTEVKKAINEPALAAYAAVWTLQQPGKTFEALTSAVYCYARS
jgi:NAD(P)H-hydrate repair Nnr-like enzyme with NAD(P)H-hydrate dehydratase domain